MRINEYNSLEEFIDEFTGEWSPVNGHWFGLDFSYNNQEYRLHTGSMYQENNNILADGTTAVFGIYRKNKTKTDKEYTLLGEYSNMNDLLENRLIENKKFKEIIMDDTTEILGKD